MICGDERIYFFEFERVDEPLEPVTHSSFVSHHPFDDACRAACQPGGASATAVLSGRRRRRNASDNLYLEVEAGEPIYPDRRPIGVRRFAEDLLFDSHNRSELVFGIGVKAGYVHDVIHRAAGRAECRIQVFECQLYLPLEIGFRRSVGAAADLSRHKQQVAGSNCCGIAVLFVKGMPVCGENSLAGHSDFLLDRWPASAE